MIRKYRLRRLAATLIASLVALAGLVAAEPAKAGTFPGRNGLIAYALNGDIYTIRADGTGRQQLTFTSDTELGPTWSPDGQHIAYVRLLSNNNFEIFRMSKDGTGVKRLTYNSAVDREPSWSRDGRRIAFTSSRTGRYQVFTMRSDRTEREVAPVNAYPSAASSYSPSYSPTSSRIAFVREYAGQTTLHSVLDPAACAAPCSPARLFAPAEGSRVNKPRWTPDGNAIVFTETWGPDHGNSAIAKKVLGGELTHLVWDSAPNLLSTGTCSPDGSKMVYQRIVQDRSEIWRTECRWYRTRPAPTRVTTGTAPDWQPTRYAAEYTPGESTGPSEFAR